MSSKTDKIICPHCGKAGTWTQDNTFRPFCSERCKLIDLGDWASDKHRIPGEPVSPSDIPSDSDNHDSNN